MLSSLFLAVVCQSTTLLSAEETCAAYLTLQRVYWNPCVDRPTLLFDLCSAVLQLPPAVVRHVYLFT